MKPLLLHGPAISISRRKLQELKGKFEPENVVVFDSEARSGQVIANLMTVPMFSPERLIIWENPMEGFDLPVSNSQLPTTFILWFDHEVDVKKWPGFEALFFPESKEISVFPFLDLLAVKDERSSTAYKKAFLEMEKLTKANYDIHYLLTMVFYLLRTLAVTPINAPDFVKRKLVRQRIEFTTEKIRNLYKTILEIDFKIKSGLLEKPQAEFLLVNEFISGA